MYESKLELLLVGDIEQSDILQLLLENIPNVKIVGTANSAKDYMDTLLREQNINAVFLGHNVNTEWNAIEAYHLLRLRGRMVPTILITNQTLPATYVADLGMIDILEAPFTFERVKQGIDKQRWSIKQTQFMSSGGLFVPVVSNDIQLYTPNEILFIESINRIVYVHTSQEQLESKISIKLYENYLLFHDFVLTHRSCLINLNQVQEIRENTVHFKHSNQTAVITDDKKASFTKQFQVFLNKRARN
ncbi:LuxR family two-component response regulator [Paenibacillus vortex V453]|uniref:LuxR family two-component response regulator n=1 Tax=Paenibacillus vortex V453 TaxID=715225 RepID=A0A2R9T2V7_9BACL|nr:LytTR family DNA-binding domain-containing protein [Paenibacillus vortex]EFU43850.1 LuxR family two-component response regulator [Paenibacillus vortex V453]